MATYQWNAIDYAKSSRVQQQWARELIRKLELKGSETLLDIGCGDGKITAEISASVPKGSVLGIDSSEAMVALAQSQYPAYAFPNLRFRQEDAGSLPFHNEFDVVFSNATLHWVQDHRPVLRGIFDGLKHQGRTLLQIGGRGNAAEVLAAFDTLTKKKVWSRYFVDFNFPYGFFAPDEYDGWLRDSGLKAKRIELIPKDMAHHDRLALESWIRTTWLPYTQRIPEENRNTFIAQLADSYLEHHPADRSGIVHVAMMRLEVEAFKD